MIKTNNPKQSIQVFMVFWFIRENLFNLVSLTVQIWKRLVGAIYFSNFTHARRHKEKARVGSESTSRTA